MISNTSGTIHVDGVNPAFATVRYKRGDDDIASADFYYVGEDSEGGKKPFGTLAAVVTGELRAYITKQLKLDANAAYVVKGKAIPGDRLVYLSTSDENSTGKTDTAALVDSIKYCTYADADGEFEFPHVYESSTRLYLWFDALSVEAASTTSLTYECTQKSEHSLPVVGPDEVTDPPEDVESGDPIFYLKSCTLNRSGSHSNPEFEIHGDCSRNFTNIYVSNSGSQDIEILRNTIVDTTVPAGGSYSFKFSAEYDITYTVWGVTSVFDDYITVESIEEEEGEIVCLSGNTLITMFNGEQQRLDEIQENDLVLSSDGVATRVNVVMRGGFNPYHVVYQFEDGTMIDETHHHRFYNVEQGFYQRLQSWQIGEHALNCRGEKIALVSKELIEEPAQMFGIWTESGNYFANGLLSGAASCNKKFLAEADAEKLVQMMLSADEAALLELAGLEGVLP